MIKPGSKATEISVRCISVEYNEVVGFNIVCRNYEYCSRDKMCIPCLYLILFLQDVSIPDLIKQLDILGDNGVS